jgi:hypothetical protein
MRTLTLVALALSFTAPLFAQNVQPAPGERVRVQAIGESSPRIFTLQEVIADTLVLEDANEGTPAFTRMPMGSISRLEVSAGHRPNGARALRGAAWGFGGGALVGATIGLASGDDEGTFLAFSAEEKAVLAGVTLGAAGLVVGTVIGLAINTEQWRRIPLEQITVSPSMGGAVVVGFQYRFR